MLHAAGLKSRATPEIHSANAGPGQALEAVLRPAEVQTAPGFGRVLAPRQPDTSAVSAERNRHACDLHDSVSQTLFAANLLAAALARSAGTDETVRGQVQLLERLNRSALAELRLMLFELRPDALTSMRLPELLQQAVEVLAGRGGVEVSTNIADASPLQAAERIEVYRIAQAALCNIGRHSGASHAHLQWATPVTGPAVLRIRRNSASALRFKRSSN